MTVDKLTPEGKIYYETAGSADNSPVIFLHGWGGSTASFGGVFNHLSNNHFVINLDFYGFGKSDIPQRPLAVSDYTDSVIELLEYLGVQNTHIIAHSFGGRVAIKLAAQRPELVGKIILVDSAGLRPKRGIKYYFRVIKYKAAKFLSRFFKGIDLSRYGSDDYRALPEVMRGTFVRVVNEDLTRYLGAIKAPTLIVWGENDQDTPLYMAKKLHKHIKNSGLVVLKGAGHYSYLDKFSQFLAVADSFLGSH